MNLFKWTGNPFVDSGISAILAYCNKDSPEQVNEDDLAIMRELISELYVKVKWVKILNVVFTSNTHVTHNSAKTVAKKEERLNNYLDSLLKTINPLGSEGDCIACGSRNAESGKNRTAIPLTGYGHSHFFPSLAAGADYCNLCAFAVQCSPLTMYNCGPKLAILHSNSSKVMRVWAKRAIKFINAQIATREFDGCYSDGYRNPVNALFHIAQDLIISYEERWKDQNIGIRLYHFTNFTQLPTDPLKIYDLPAPVFRFLAEVRSHPKYSEWLQIVTQGYHRSGKTEEKEYLNNRNEIYYRILNSKSIIPYFFSISRKKSLGDWSLLKIYLTEVLFMPDGRINSIKKIADEIASMIKNNSNGKKRLGQLEQVRSYANFRSVILRLIHDRVSMKAATPLVTLDDYFENLFPNESLGWNETRDLILFRIYEQLHEWLVNEGITVEESEDDQIEEKINEDSNQ